MSQLGNKAADAVYLYFARYAMPVGTVGLLMAGLFAASMSSMDSALNKNAGIFVRSIYQPFLAKRRNIIVTRNYCESVNWSALLVVWELLLLRFILQR